MNRDTIELVTKIDSIDFYKKIYNKACNSLWEIRVPFLYSLMSGILLWGWAISQISYMLVSNTWRLKDIQNHGMLLVYGLFLIAPTIIIIINNFENKGRSDKYVRYLKNLKMERNLTNDDIDQLIKDVANLKIKYKTERNIILNILLTLAKLVVFPITAAIFTGLISNLDYAFLGLSLTCIVIVIIGFMIWSDFKTFENFKNFGIKYNYLANSVERELKFMKKL